MDPPGIIGQQQSAYGNFGSRVGRRRVHKSIDVPMVFIAYYPMANKNRNVHGF